MGVHLIAKCECGFIDGACLGADVIDFQTKCYAPAICLNCYEFTVKNYLSKRPRCSKCKR